MNWVALNFDVINNVIINLIKQDTGYKVHVL